MHISATAISILAWPNSTRMETGSVHGVNRVQGRGNSIPCIPSQLMRHNQIYVADRGNARIQVVDTMGKLVNTIKIDVAAPANSPVAIGNRPSEAAGGSAGLWRPGSPWAICITPGPTQYLYVADAYPGRIYKLTTDGKVLGSAVQAKCSENSVGFTSWHAIRKRTVRRRAFELARSEANPSPLK
jgi:hypothetical protein